VIDAKTNQPITDVPIRIPGLETLRGVLPIGLAFHQPTGWLLVAEAGSNAVGVIDTKNLKLIGHLPVGWFPTRVLIDGDQVYVSNARGHGAGPNATQQHDESFATVLRRGSISLRATRATPHARVKTIKPGKRPIKIGDNGLVDHLVPLTPTQ
jgi:YVTN family beta-propeller protein